MIDSLSGILLEKTAQRAVVECGGVGYGVQVPFSTLGALPAAGEKVTLYTYMNVTDNDVSLFGFATKAERETFTMLIGVSGVGPKVGLAILSALPPDRIALAVGGGDHKAFTAANGVGPKLAQRIVLELKDKVAAGFGAAGVSLGDMAAAAPAGAGAGAQAVAALVSLGYTQSEAAACVAKIDPGLPVAEIIRLALQGIGEGR